MTGVDTTPPELLRSAVDAFRDAVFVLDADTTVRALNAAARSWLAADAVTVVGRRLLDLVPESTVVAQNAAFVTRLPRLIAGVLHQRQAAAEHEVRLYDIDGNLVTAAVRLDPLRETAGPALVVWTLRFPDPVSTVFQGCPVPLARLTLDARVIEVNAEFELLADRHARDLVGRSLPDLLPLADRGRWLDAVAAVRGRTSRAVAGVRLRRPDGTDRRVAATLRLQGAAEHVDAVLLVALQDVTDHERDRTELAARVLSGAALSRLAAAALAASDPRSLAAVATSVFGETPGVAEVGWPGEVGPDRDAASGQRWVAAALPGWHPPGQLRLRLSSPRDDADLDSESLAGCSDDVAATFVSAAAGVLATGAARLRAEAGDRAHTLRDSLTGLANRRLLVDLLTEALAHASASGSPVGVVFVDLERFRIVNEQHGHAVGDAVLVEFADRLRESVRGNDVVCRWGGDEFVVLCLRAGDEEAVAHVAERIRAAVQTPFAVGALRLPLSAGVGVATSDAEQSVDGLLRAAEQALDADRAAARAHEVASSRDPDRLSSAADG